MFSALLDTGAARSYCGNRLAKTCQTAGIPAVPYPNCIARTANGTTVRIPAFYQLELQINGRIFSELLAYLPNLSSDLVLGMDFMRKRGVKVDLKTNEIYLDGEQVGQRIFDSPIVSLDPKEPLILTPQEERKLQEFLETELPKFDNIKGTTHLIQHEIKLLNPEPIKQRHRPQNPKMQAIINEEVDRMLQEQIIEPSESPWSSPVVMVRKKDGKFRFCVDFQKVNDITQKDAYPLPFINAILDKLRHAQYISTIDLRQGYWQIPLTEGSKPITAFTVPGRGLFQFRVMPFGLHSAPATFQRLMDRIIGPELDPYCFAYLDDIIVLGDTFEEHLENLREVFRRIRAANLTLNAEKCQFGRRSLKYLGHVVTPSGITTDPEKVDSIVQIPPPTTVRGLRRFLGVASWYRRFIPGFSQIAAPLHKLLKKGQRFAWGSEEQASFEKLKKSLTEAPVLACPDFSKPFVLQTDASDYGLGAALIQYSKDGDHVIAYASRSLTTSERKMSATEKECAAIVWGIEKMRPYLELYQFTVVSDHQSLKWLHSLDSPSGRLARWRMFLQQFDFTIKYRKGVLNRIADTLSRDPLPVGEEPEADPVFIVESDQTCSWYEKKMREVEANPKLFPDFCIKEGRLYRHFWDMSDLTEPEMSNPWKLCVPKSARPKVLQENHDAPTAGHLGIAKTIARVAKRYYWPGMFREVASYVRGCSSCQRYKTSQQLPAGKMQPTFVQEPWASVSSDLIGPLPRSKKGNCYVVMFQDRFTKWVECRPIRNATSKAVTSALQELVLCRFGCPKTVLTDNGTQYTGKAFRTLLKEYGIRHRLTPPYAPQDNPVERTNKTFKTMIAQWSENEHRTWDVSLPDLMFALNTSRHDSTGFSAAFLNFGREPTPPNTLYQENQSGNAHDQEETVGDDEVAIRELASRVTRLEEVHELVRVNIARAFSTQSHYYNLRRRDWRCHVGDRVYRKEHPLSSAVKGIAAKLAPKFSGPYIVHRVISPVIYDLKDGSGNLVPRIHIKDLKPAHV